MRRSSKKLPRDTNQLATAIVALSVEEPNKTQSVKEYLAAIGRNGGLKGGKARAEILSASKRKAIARKGAKARWSKKKV
jgi:hypothetical protein